MGYIYDAMVTHVMETYTLPAQIWFDGGYSSSQKERIETLLHETQPQAVIFNGCDTDGSCLTNHPSQLNSGPG